MEEMRAHRRADLSKAFETGSIFARFPRTGKSGLPAEFSSVPGSYRHSIVDRRGNRVAYSLADAVGSELIESLSAATQIVPSLSYSLLNNSGTWIIAI